MSNWTEWVADVTNHDAGWPICWCPYERETDSIVWGMNLLQDDPPGKIAAVVHEGGQEAVDAWCEVHKETVARWVAQDPA